MNEIPNLRVFKGKFTHNKCMNTEDICLQSLMQRTDAPPERREPPFTLAPLL